VETTPHAQIHIADQLNVTLKSLVATITLLDEGGTVPFIARYRKKAPARTRIGAIAERLQFRHHAASSGDRLAPKYAFFSVCLHY
jgi:transcriptional accessory protein Tex/SPT6